MLCCDHGVCGGRLILDTVAAATWRFYDQLVTLVKLNRCGRGQRFACPVTPNDCISANLGIATAGHAERCYPAVIRKN